MLSSRMSRCYGVTKPFICAFTHSCARTLASKQHGTFAMQLMKQQDGWLSHSLLSSRRGIRTFSTASAHQPNTPTSAAATSHLTASSSTISCPPFPLTTLPRTVYGVGVDIAHIPRFARVLARHGQRFLDKCLHEKEKTQIAEMAMDIAAMEQRPARATRMENDAPSSSAPSPLPPSSSSSPVDWSAASCHPPVLSFLASRWAVKEAVIKAAGKRLLFPDMCVTRIMKGKEEQRKHEQGEGNAASTAPSDAAFDPRARLELSGDALSWFQQQGLGTRPHMALSHDGEYAIAFVCIEKGDQENRSKSIVEPV